MELKKKTIDELQQIVAKDHGVVLTHEQTSELAVQLLRLTRVGLAALARAGDRKSPVQAREVISLEPKTSA